VSCIESVTPGKNSRRPVVLQLQPNFDHLAQMKTLQISFLDSDGKSSPSFPPLSLLFFKDADIRDGRTDQKAFCEFLAANNR
jgi:hypothetical protein